MIFIQMILSFLSGGLFTHLFKEWQINRGAIRIGESKMIVEYAKGNSGRIKRIDLYFEVVNETGRDIIFKIINAQIWMRNPKLLPSFININRLNEEPTYKSFVDDNTKKGCECRQLEFENCVIYPTFYVKPKTVQVKTFGLFVRGHNIMDDFKNGKIVYLDFSYQIGKKTYEAKITNVILRNAK